MKNSLRIHRWKFIDEKQLLAEAEVWSMKIFLFVNESWIS